MSDRNTDSNNIFDVQWTKTLPRLSLRVNDHVVLRELREGAEAEDADFEVLEVELENRMMKTRSDNIDEKALMEGQRFLSERLEEHPWRVDKG